MAQSLPPHPALSPGERVNLRTLRQRAGNVGFDPTHRSSAPRLDQHLHDRTPWGTTLPDEPNSSPSPVGRGRGEGEGITRPFKAFDSAVGSGLNSIEHSGEPKNRSERCAI